MSDIIPYICGGFVAGVAFTCACLLPVITAIGRDVMGGNDAE